MKTHEEIKKGLECCRDNVSCMKCTYYDRRDRKYACETALLADALAYIQQLEAQVPKWISVEERLPNDHERVLIAVQFENGISIHTTGFSGGAWHVTLLDSEHVTHWMPLPEPPKEG